MNNSAYTNVRPKASVIGDIKLTSDQDKAYDDIMEWLDTNDPLYGLFGGAGTGKSFLVNLICRSFKSSIAITAPTHKAKRVVSDFTGRPAETLHSLLGLRPDASIEGFDIDNIIFAPKNKATIYLYRLIIVDEYSMINDDLYKFLYDNALKFRVKILFVGDDAQLPPIEKDGHIPKYDDPFLRDIEHYNILTEPARQEPTNPLLFLLYALRYDIKPSVENFDTFCFYGKKFLGSRWNDFKDSLKLESILSSLKTAYKLPDVIYSNLYEAVIKQFPNMVNLATEEGFKHLTNTEFAENLVKEVLSDNFANDLNHVKCMAFTNKNVGEWNKYVRKIRFPNATDIIEVGDLVTSYTTITYDFQKIFTNSEDYEIVEKEEGTKDVPLVGSSTNKVITVKGWHTEFKSLSTGVTTMLFVISPNSLKEFLDAHNYYHSAAKKYKKWREYFAFKSQFCLPVDLKGIYKNSKNLPTKDMGYGYCITTHKSQGSSYSVAFVNTTNIFSYKQIKLSILAEQGKFPGPKDIYEIDNFIKRLLYVAYSRAKQRAYGLL